MVILTLNRGDSRLFPPPGPSDREVDKFPAPGVSRPDPAHADDRRDQACGAAAGWYGAAVRGACSSTRALLARSSVARTSGSKAGLRRTETYFVRGFGLRGCESASEAPRVYQLRVPLLVGSWGHQLRARSLGPACRPPAALVVSGLPGASDAPMWLRVDGT